MGAEKLCILFPGIGYTAERPLLYYAGKLFKSKGYEVISLKYTSLPGKKGNDISKMGKTFEMVMEQTREQLSDVDLDSYDNVVLVGKSIGTIAAVHYASEQIEEKKASGLEEKIRYIHMTPLAPTFSKSTLMPAIAFHGTKDPWVETEVVEKECERLGIPLYKYKDANHSLETGDIETDIESAGDVMKRIEQFI